MMRLGTRKSPLALAQAEKVRQQLLQNEPDRAVEIVGITTHGDKIQDRPLTAIGGKGLFLKELEEALLAGTIDIAVHSVKDVPAKLSDRFVMPTLLRRGSPLDAFVSLRFKKISDLPPGVRIGTSSPRRKAVLRGTYPHVAITELRGNINTRLARLEEGRVDAMIIAAVGLSRLELDDRVSQLLPADVMLPAAGQGAIGVECLAGAQDLIERLAPLDDIDTHRCVDVERAVSRGLGGSCSLPLAAHAVAKDGLLLLKAMVGDPESGKLVFAAAEGHINDGGELATQVVDELLHHGAGEILRRVKAID